MNLLARWCDEWGKRGLKRPGRKAEKQGSTMLIYKVIGAITAAAISAAVVMALPGFSPELQASTGNPGQVLKTDLGLVVFFQAADFTSQSVPSKADRIDYRPLGTACSQNAWPYFEASCLRDRNQAMGEARAVRMIGVGAR